MNGCEVQLQGWMPPVVECVTVPSYSAPHPRRGLHISIHCHGTVCREKGISRFYWHMTCFGQWMQQKWHMQHLKRSFKSLWMLLSPLALFLMPGKWITKGIRDLKMRSLWREQNHNQSRLQMTCEQEMYHCYCKPLKCGVISLPRSYLEEADQSSPLHCA